MAFSTLLSVLTAIFIVWRYSHSFMPTESTRTPTPRLSRRVLFASSNSMPWECAEAASAATCTASGWDRYREERMSKALRQEKPFDGGVDICEKTAPDVTMRMPDTKRLDT